MIDGAIGLVDGKYSYHHYMQDNFNDDVSDIFSLLLQITVDYHLYPGFQSSLSLSLQCFLVIGFVIMTLKPMTEKHWCERASLEPRIFATDHLHHPTLLLIQYLHIWWH